MGEYEQADVYIENIQRFTDKHDLAYIRSLMDRLEIDESRFHIIHTAGTNGKGSVCIYTESMMRSGGRRVGTFTSPHLVSLRERIRIDGQDISEDRFLASYRRVRSAVDAFVKEGNQHPSFFEFLFFMAMDAFQESGVDWVILETGLGGRLDTTNVIRHPAVTAIVSISLDHTFFLGNTIAEIAAEKAGILKKGVPVVYLDLNPESSEVIRRRADMLGCPQLPVRTADYKILKNTGRYIDFSVPGMYDANHTFRIYTSGSYQPMNAVTALHIIHTVSGWNDMTQEEREVQYRTERDGLMNARWPGRMEEVLPGVYVDGGHNPEGTESFLDSMHTLEENKCIGRRKSLIFAVSDDKDYETMIRRLAGSTRWDTITVTRFASSRSVEPAKLAGLFSKYTNTPVRAAEDACAAFDTAMKDRQPDETLFVIGSLYLAGMILQHVKEDRI